MPKRSSKAKRKKGPADTNRLVADIVAETTGEGDDAPQDDAKNPAAVALGRLGGLKGGHARAAALSKKRRVEIARDAANRRWKDKK